MISVYCSFTTMSALKNSAHSLSKQYNTSVQAIGGLVMGLEIFHTPFVLLCGEVYCIKCTSMAIKQKLSERDITEVIL